MHPTLHRVLVPIQPWRYLETALAIHQQQKAVIPLVQPHPVRPAKGSLSLISCVGRVRNRKPAAVLAFKGAYNLLQALNIKKTLQPSKFTQN
jgi:hypothetical protein